MKTTIIKCGNDYQALLNRLKSTQLWVTELDGKPFTMREPVGIDLETYTLPNCTSGKGHGLHPMNAKIRLCQIGFYHKPDMVKYRDIQAYNFAPIDEVFILDLATASGSDLFESLNNANYDPKRTFRLIAHNAGFELKHLKNQGVSLYPIWCTQRANLLIQGCNAKLHQFSKLADLVYEFEGVVLDKTEQTSDWSNPNLTQSQYDYATLDVVYLGSIALKQAIMIAAQGQTRACDLEMRKLIAETHVNLHGLNIDTEAWINLCESELELAKNDRAKLVEMLPKRLPDPGKSKELKESLALAGIICERNTLKFWKEIHTQSLNSFNHLHQGISHAFIHKRPDLALNHLPRLPINPSSPIQLFDAFSELVKEKGIKLPSSKVKEIEYAVREFPEYDDVIKTLKSYSKHNKAAKYIGVLKEIYADGRLKPQLTTTLTSRQASSNPNLQNIPRAKPFRAPFKAPETFAVDRWQLLSRRLLERNSNLAKFEVKTGRKAKLVVADYSAIELRAAAEITCDPALVEIFSKPKAKPHEYTASRFLNKNIADVTPEEKQQAKPFNFGLLYYMSARTLQTYAYFNYGVKLTLEQATELRDLWLKIYAGVHTWHQEGSSLLNRKKYGLMGKNKSLIGGKTYVESRTLLGRRMLLPVELGFVEAGLNIRHEVVSSVKMPMTQYFACPVQGSSTGEGLGEAMWLLLPELDRTCWKLCMTIHDEFVLEVPEDEAEQAKETLVKIMIEGMKKVLVKTPVEVEAKVCDRWSEKG